MARYEKDRLSADAISNKRRYDNEYLKEYYTMFGIHISKEEAQKYTKLLKEKSISRVEFIRYVFKLLEKGKLKMED